MKKLFLCFAITLMACSSRHVREATDITPGIAMKEKLDWRYGAGDIKIQSSRILNSLMNRWYARTAWEISFAKPRIVVTQVDNRTDMYISLDMIRDIFESYAVDDGRFVIVVGDTKDQKELDQFLQKIISEPKYNSSTRLNEAQVTAPQLLAKIRLTKAVTSDCHFDFEDYRMTVSLFDIETQEIIDSAWDVLSKKVNKH